MRSPGFATRTGQVVSVKDRPGKSAFTPEALERLAHHAPPPWISLDKGARAGTIVAAPQPEDIGMTFDITKIREFYSR